MVVIVAITTALAALIATLVLPYLAVGADLQKAASEAFWREVYVDVYAGPVVALTAVSSALVIILSGRRAPLALLAVAALVALYGCSAGSNYSHDFSHMVFDDCRGYGSALSGIYTIAWAGLLITVVGELKRRRSPPGGTARVADPVEMGA